MAISICARGVLPALFVPEMIWNYEQSPEGIHTVNQEIISGCRQKQLIQILLVWSIRSRSALPRESRFTYYFIAKIKHY